MNKFTTSIALSLLVFQMPGAALADELVGSAEAEQPPAVTPVMPPEGARPDEATEARPERDYYGRVNSSGRQLYQRIDVPCVGAAGGFVVNGKVGVCQQVGGSSGISRVIETDQKYVAVIAGVGISAGGTLGAFGFTCESKTNDPDWEKNFAGTYYGIKGGITYLGGGGMGLFGNKRGQCMISGLDVGAMGDLSAAVLYIRPVGKKTTPSTVSK